MDVTEDPHWERGKRVHGYWVGLTRVGWVGLPPGKGSCKIAGYTWEVECPKRLPKSGWASSLRSAKRAVEKCYKKELELIRLWESA